MDEMNGLQNEAAEIGFTAAPLSPGRRARRSAAGLPRLVQPAELAAVLGADDLRVVDLGDADAHQRNRVPGAVMADYVDLVGLAPPATGLLPAPEQLAATLSALGIGPETHVVAYDDERNSLAARFLWTLDVAVHGNWSLLDGGLRGWLAGGFPTAVGTGEVAPRPLAVPANGPARADRDYVLDRIGDTGTVILDVRSAAEYRGADVRAARGGHIPGAVNLEWTDLIDPLSEPHLLPPDELNARLRAVGVTPEREVIVYCQTHHRSSHTYVVLRSLGFPRVRGYDGSWSEWGNDPDLPVATESAR